MCLVLRITHFPLPFFPRFAKMEIKEKRKGGVLMAAKKIELEEIAALTKEQRGGDHEGCAPRTP